MGRTRNFFILVSTICALILVGNAGAASAFGQTNDGLKVVKVGVLKFGTVNWELDTIKRRGLDLKHGIDLEVTGVVGKNSAAIALQAGKVDVIVTDFIWVSRQRNMGADYAFVPHSLAVGGLMAPRDSGINSIADLRGKTLGIAGGPVDKSWLIFRAFGRMELEEDLADVVKAKFGAPPLLNELLKKGDVDAVLNFWHYNARLRAQGMKEVISVSEILPRLGVQVPPPFLGWVFHEEWASKNQEAVVGFLRASLEAKEVLRTDDEAWEMLKERMSVNDDEATFLQLRDDYRAGIVTRYGPEDIAAAQKIFEFLAEIGGKRLVGDSKYLAAGTFWRGFSF
ncbi:MAG: ABC transporter substrate-binding protein [Proteobacteria bacterium]|nr:ABC transporter substrate-binding protein [Pseudomonadota bacterium]